MLKLKYVLDDIIEHAYKDDARLPLYKKYYIEYLRKKLKTKLGDYRADNHHIRIFTEGLDDQTIIKVSLHEMAHHCDNVQRGRTDHGPSFYEAYRKLLYAALDMGLFDLEGYRNAIENSRDRSWDKNKVLKFLDEYKPNKTTYKQGVKRVRVQKAFEIKEKLKDRGYIFNSYDKTWEKEIKEGRDLSQEEYFLRRIKADYYVEDAVTLTF